MSSGHGFELVRLYAGTRLPPGGDLASKQHQAIGSVANQVEKRPIGFDPRTFGSLTGRLGSCCVRTPHGSRTRWTLFVTSAMR